MFMISISTYAQSGTAAIYPYVDIRPFMSLKVEVSPIGLNYSFTEMEDFENGISKSGVFNISVKSNQNWILMVSSSQVYLNAVSTQGDPNIPVSILSVKKSLENSFLPIQKNFTQVTSGNRGGSNRAGNSFNLDLKASPGFNYATGFYTCDVVFTMTNN